MSRVGSGRERVCVAQAQKSNEWVRFELTADHSAWSYIGYTTHVLCILLRARSQGKYFRAVFPCLFILCRRLLTDLQCVLLLWSEEWERINGAVGLRISGLGISCYRVSPPGWTLRDRTTLPRGGPTGCTISRMLTCASSRLIATLNRRTPTISRWGALIDFNRMRGKLMSILLVKGSPIITP